jgi:hypothetical protein
MEMQLVTLSTSVTNKNASVKELSLTGYPIRKAAISKVDVTNVSVRKR